MAMQKTWQYLSPPNPEKNMVGKWFTVIYAGKRRATLYVAKLINRFLDDEELLMQTSF